MTRTTLCRITNANQQTQGTWGGVVWVVWVCGWVAVHLRHSMIKLACLITRPGGKTVYSPHLPGHPTTTKAVQASRMDHVEYWNQILNHKEWWGPCGCRGWGWGQEGRGQKALCCQALLANSWRASYFARRPPVLCLLTWDKWNIIHDITYGWH